MHGAFLHSGTANLRSPVKPYCSIYNSISIASRYNSRTLLLRTSAVWARRACSGQHYQPLKRTLLPQALRGDSKASSEPVQNMPSTWTSLGTPTTELQLEFTLPTGQSFRWRKTNENEYTGVIGTRLVQLRQEPNDVVYRVLARGNDAPVSQDHAVLSDYFNLNHSLTELSSKWGERCSRFKAVSPYFQGARMLRQDPVECLFQFICSSNNHISRIHGMVERLCSAYGTQLKCDADFTRQEAIKLKQEDGNDDEEDGSSGKSGNGTMPAFYAFPTLEQLTKATEAELRDAGFGYRARYIVGSVAELMSKPEGGRQWLLALRKVPFTEAAEALETLPGIGPKVAACICLFSLDKSNAIPVDTHVWQIAVRYYAPHLASKSLTKKLHDQVMDIFVKRFGEYAGWAHNTLFIAELASQQHRLPLNLRSAAAKAKARKEARTKGEPADDTSSDEGDEDADDADNKEGSADDKAGMEDGPAAATGRRQRAARTAAKRKMQEAIANETSSESSKGGSGGADSPSVSLQQLKSDSSDSDVSAYDSDDDDGKAGAKSATKRPASAAKKATATAAKKPSSGSAAKKAKTATTQAAAEPATAKRAPAKRGGAKAAAVKAEPLLAASAPLKKKPATATYDDVDDFDDLNS